MCVLHEKITDGSGFQVCANASSASSVCVLGTDSSGASDDCRGRTTRRDCSAVVSFGETKIVYKGCLLYTSDAADE